MADDIILTQEEQDERARQWLKDNGLAILLGVALGLGGIFGYQTWQARQIAQAEQASALFSRVLAATQTSELADISADVEQLKSEFSSSPYAAKAALLRARQLAVSDMPAAQAELEWVLGHAEEEGLQHTARIRQAKVLIAQNELAAAKALLNDQDAVGFTSFYAELRGDVARLEGDFAAAREQYQIALDNLSQREIGYSAILNLKRNRLPSTENAPAGSDDGDSEGSIAEPSS